jgi:starch synthase
MTSLIPMYMKTTYKNDPMFKNAKAVFSIYNTAFDHKFDRTSMLEKVKMLDIDDKMLNNLHSADYEAMMKIAAEYADVVLRRTEPYSEKLNQVLAGIQETDSKRMAEIDHESEDWVENYMSIYQDLVG